jgi:hypothetical protein
MPDWGRAARRDRAGTRSLGPGVEFSSKNGSLSKPELNEVLT